MASVIEILEDIGSRGSGSHRAKGIEVVTIDKIEFTNYGQYSFVWEKSFVTSPKRSVSGSLGDLDDLPTFLTAHLVIDFSIMSIDDYRKIMKLHYSKNQHTVTCYDPIYNTTRTLEMYFATEEMPKLYTIAEHRFRDDWEDWIDLVGVTEYKVELIGTNNDTIELE